MEPLLSEVEVRVLGALIEKQITTPDYYPLTLNALTAACNQKSNRAPVVDFDEKTVVRALESLRDKELARMLSGAEMRVPKYYHLFTETLGFTSQEVGVLCVLMLRGPQTVGEIRGRSGRLYEFADLAEVEQALQQLMEREGGPVVMKLPRQIGRKESRYAQLLAGEPEIATEEEGEAQLEKAALEVRTENERLEQLEIQVQDLQRQIEDLRLEFATFKRQFE